MQPWEHIRWLGGGSGAGKSTLSRRLAGQYGLRVYSCDATIGDHGGRLSSTVAPLLEDFRRMSMDRRWLHDEPEAMCRRFPWFQGEGFDLIIQDLQAMPTDRVVLVEGFRLLPHLVVPYLAERGHAMWLLPTPHFRQQAFAQRSPADAFWLRTSDPPRALAKLLERDRMFTDAVAVDAANNGLQTLVIDGRHSVEEEVDQLALHFGLHR